MISLPCEQMYESKINITASINKEFLVMKYGLTLVLVCLMNLGLKAQLNVDFDNNGDLSIWTGDISNFIINEESRLQLAAAEAGSSSIFTPITAADSVLWSMDCLLYTSPSPRDQRGSRMPSSA